MRRNLNCVIGLSLSFVLAGLASTASAQATAPVNTSPHKELIKELLHAHHLLVHADHDYDGRRAKAAEEVHKALKELGYHPKHKAAAAGGAAAPVPSVLTPVAPAGQPKIQEAQASSDAQMREALGILEKASTQISGKHAKAEGNVKAAIAHINAALAIK